MMETSSQAGLAKTLGFLSVAQSNRECQRAVELFRARGPMEGSQES